MTNDQDIRTLVENFATDMKRLILEDIRVSLGASLGHGPESADHTTEHPLHQDADEVSNAIRAATRSRPRDLGPPRKQKGTGPSLKSRIIAVLKKAKNGLTSKEITGKLGEPNVNILNTQLWVMKKQRTVKQKKKFGPYVLTASA
jgi:hypothetical protein